MAIATRLINLNEDRREMRRKESEEKGVKRKDEKKDIKREFNSSIGSRNDDKKYDPLNAPKSEILMWIK